MGKVKKFLTSLGVVTTIGVVSVAGLTGCTKTGEDVDYKYLILKQSDRNYTLHSVVRQRNEDMKDVFITKCGMFVYKANYDNEWRFDVKTENAKGTEMLDACFRCEDEKGVEQIGYEAVCSKCFPNGYEQE